MKSTTILAVAIGLGLTTSAVGAAPRTTKTSVHKTHMSTSRASSQRSTADARAATRRLNEQQLGVAQGGVAGTPAMADGQMPGNAGTTGAAAMTPGTMTAPMTNDGTTPPSATTSSGMGPSDGQMNTTNGQMDMTNGQMNGPTGTTPVPPRF